MAGVQGEARAVLGAGRAAQGTALTAVARPLAAVYGAPLDGVSVVAVPPDLAHLHAEAHRRLTGTPVAVHRGDGRLVDPVTGEEPPAEVVSDRWVVPGDDVVAALDAASAPVVIAGPGVVHDGAVPGLHALAAAGSLGVLNTWGAKGVFDWRSRHHLATVGLQAFDFRRGGAAEADLIVASGIDEREARADWRLASVVTVPPLALGPLAERWGRPRREITVPPLRADLARITQEGWRIDGPLLQPSRVTLAYSEQLGPAGGLVAADPGTAGYWVARTFATTVVGGAQVPGDGAARGFAVACATVARLLQPARPVLAVVDAVTDAHERLLDAAQRLGVTVALEVWAADGDRIGADSHGERLGRLLADGGRETVATDPAQFDRMVDVAGPLVAWGHGA